MTYLIFFCVGLGLGFFLYEHGFRSQLPFYKEKN